VVRKQGDKTQDTQEHIHRHNEKTNTRHVQGHTRHTEHSSQTQFISIADANTRDTSHSSIKHNLFNQIHIICLSPLSRWISYCFSELRPFYPHWQPAKCMWGLVAPQVCCLTIPTCALIYYSLWSITVHYYVIKVCLTEVLTWMICSIIAIGSPYLLDVNATGCDQNLGCCYVKTEAPLAAPCLLQLSPCSTSWTQWGLFEEAFSLAGTSVE
jgi:hypothetical protein